jgi:hypothetical protein
MRPHSDGKKNVSGWAATSSFSPRIVKSWHRAFRHGEKRNLNAIPIGIACQHPCCPDQPSAISHQGHILTFNLKNAPTAHFSGLTFDIGTGLRMKGA